MLFKIVCATEGVKLDGKAVVPGTEVFSRSKKLTIRKNEHAGILTHEGYAFMLEKTINVDKVVKFVYRKSNGLNILGEKPKGPLLKPAIDDNIEMMGLTVDPWLKSSGDSLILFWTDKLGDRNPYVIRAGSDYGKYLRIDTVRTNWRLYHKNQILKNGSVSIIQVNDSKSAFTEHTRQYLFYGKPADLELLKDHLSGIPRGEKDPEVMRMIIYEVHDYNYDQLYHWFRWVSKKKGAKAEFSKTYLDVKARTYHLDQFNFHK